MEEKVRHESMLNPSPPLVVFFSKRAYGQYLYRSYPRYHPFYEAFDNR